jgi:hypothetical protein
VNDKSRAILAHNLAIVSDHTIEERLCLSRIRLPSYASASAQEVSFSRAPGKFLGGQDYRLRTTIQTSISISRWPTRSSATVGSTSVRWSSSIRSIGSRRVVSSDGSKLNWRHAEMVPRPLVAGLHCTWNSLAEWFPSWPSRRGGRGWRYYRPNCPRLADRPTHDHFNHARAPSQDASWLVRAGRDDLQEMPRAGAASR